MRGLNASDLYELTKRNMLLFLKNISTVVFSLLAPILILLIYVLFLGNSMVDSIALTLPDLQVEQAVLKGIINSWMVSGVIGIACMTVSFNSLLNMVQDKENGVINDFIASPINPVKLLLSYFLASTIVTFGICLILLLGATAFLSISAGVFFGFFEIMQLIFILLLSCLSAVMLMMCLMSFFNTNGAAAAFNGVFSALIGFLIGAYMPMGFMPKGVRYVSSLIPASHSAALFRTVFMSKALEALPESITADMLSEIKQSYSFYTDFFGLSLSPMSMYLVLSASIFVFFFVYLFLDLRQKRKKGS